MMTFLRPLHSLAVAFSRAVKARGLAVVLALCCAAVSPALARLDNVNPEFTSYAASAAKTFSQSYVSPSSGRSLGGIPSPVNRSQTAGQNISAAILSKQTSYRALSGLPLGGASADSSTYDLRTTGKLTAIRNQGAYGACWSFAANASLESALLPAETWDFSENNMVMNSGYDDGFNLLNRGGNSSMAAGYLLRWDGPVNEADDPYTSAGTVRTGLQVRKHVQEILWLPQKTSEGYSASFISNVKAAIVNYGAVMSSIYYDSTAMLSNASYFYNSLCTIANGARSSCGCGDPGNCGGHLINLVGWDDNFDASYFTSSEHGTPAGNGAFIARNSWGTSVGDNGYFYISYYDTTNGVEESVFDVAQSTYNYTRQYGYDTLGWTASVPGGSVTSYWMAMQSTSAVSGEELKSVGFYTTDSTTTYKLYIYTGSTAGAPRSGTLAYSASGTMQVSGYHTLPLTSAVSLPAAGTRFSVVMQLSNQSAASPIAVEYPFNAENGYSASSYYASKAVASANQTFLSSNGTSWTDLVNIYKDTSACLKAYASATVALSTPTVYDGLVPSTDAAYSTSPYSLSANWTPSVVTASTLGGYKFRIQGPSAAETDWLDSGTAISTTTTGLTLESGSTYYFEVRAFSTDGVYSATGTSNGVIVDTVPPVTPSYIYESTGTDISYTPSSTTLSFNWGPSSDMHSGLAGYEYAVGTAAGGTDFIGWTNTTSTEVTRTGLSLAYGRTYYASVRAKDFAGLYSGIVTSDGVLVSTGSAQPPALATVPAKYGRQQSLTFSWTASADPVYGIAGYSYTLSTACVTPDLVVDTTALSVSMDVSTGAAYCFAVRGVNNEGLGSAAATYTFTVDITSPALAVSVTPDPSGAGTSEVTVLGNEALGTVGVYITPNGGSPVAVSMTQASGQPELWNGAYTVTTGHDGTAAVVVTAVDQALNSTTALSSFKIDTTAPTGRFALASTDTLTGGAFSAMLYVDDASAIVSTPTVSFTAGGALSNMTVTRVAASTFSAEGFLDSSLSSGTLTLSFAATDAAGNTGTTVTSGGSYDYDTRISSAADTTVTSVFGVTVDIPAGASTSTLVVTISSVPLTASEISGADSGDSGSVTDSGMTYKFIARDSLTGSAVTAFDNPVTVTIPYLDANSDGFVDGTTVRVTNLGMYYLDTAQNKWVLQTSAVRFDGYFSLVTSHFSIYALRQISPVSTSVGLEGAKGYPNPCRFASQTMTFGGLAAGLTGVKISVYTLSGQLVRTFSAGDGLAADNTAVWDGRNSGGDKVASGVYIAVFKADGLDTKTFKAVALW